MPGNFANAQNLVALEEVRDGIIVLKSGELRQVLMVGGTNFALKSEREQTVITQSYQNFLNSLNFPLQIIIHSRKINIEKYLRSLDDRKSQEQSALLQDQITEYQEFVRSFVQDNAIMVKTFFVVVPFTPISLPTTQSFLDFLPFGKKDAAAQAQAQVSKDAAFKEAQTQLGQRVNQVMEGLQLIGLEVVLLDTEQILELFYNFYNPETVEKQGVAGGALHG